MIALASPPTEASPARLRQALLAHKRVAIAVSGGIDSLTLAVFAQRLANEGLLDVVCFHATSAAVPGDAGERIDAVARAHGFDVVSVDAGELDDAAYTDNPVDRCYFCKSHLFDAGAFAFNDRVICTGANLDDVDDYRPGRKAAAERGVFEPFIAAGFSKDEVRALARTLGLGDLADLPASPCLSSRVETGIRIDAALLRRVDDVERAVRALGHATVRCRVRPTGLVIEHDGAIDEAAVRAVLASQLAGHPLHFAPYRRGSAFLRVVE